MADSLSVPDVSMAVTLAITTYAATVAAMFRVKSPVTGANVRISLVVPTIFAFAPFTAL